MWDQLRLSDPKSADSSGPGHLIIGLGNPGREYRDNRHNIGFMLVDRLCLDYGIRISRLQSKALVGAATIEGFRLTLAKPQTFMNLSGQSVVQLVRFYKLPLSNLLVCHDDLDLPFGTLRMRPGGGSGGQRGLASIIDQLGTQDFPRLRLGIGRPPGQMDAADYVLQSFSKSDAEMLPPFLKSASEAVFEFMRSGIEKAMTRYNGSSLEG